ncbi:NF-kappa-B essential modulator isoform X1 [Coregonus clupeaformis]|uniref:NF-kappa-B essential modulator isoform X1 n=1 Tax=Coregonus clupeaformis TaxID=59861 RepID=UPI001E1C5A92|nr:NF-kappa-B essential modulator isoform X1 [Coregonus clupeaformis]XP_045062994.1 NF-kappa-B essential modulator isoform X2 [Coregonus clupeaformis]XP_045062995.1 NF-kappa-B essential modulator isoform X1 [Coregonus clupeaformis]
MVQPQTDTWEMVGDEGGGALRVPLELAANEVVTRLLGDNQQLREALRRSNQALRERCEEMEGWQRRSREEREFLSCRFQEARALVERLARENHSLTSLASPSNPGADQGLLVNGPSFSQGSCPNSTNCSSNGGPGRGGEQEKSSETNGPMASSLVTDRRMEKRAEENEQMMLRSLSCGVTEETVQHSDAPPPSESSHLAKLTEQLQATQCRYRELQEKLDSLQKSSAQRDRTEVLLKQKDKDCAQLAKDGEALKAQVTSLLGELRERQSCLDQSQQDHNILNDKLSSALGALAASERELEQQRKQHSVTVDKLLLQTQNLETALKTDRLVITEERKKLAQLQHAYTCLFKDYDSKLKTEGGDMCGRVEEAERALALKQDLIDKLKEEVEQQRGSLETVPVLTAQAEIYKADFLAEREAREKLHQKKEELQDQLNRALAEMERLKQEGTSRARMEQMQQRHLEDFIPRPGGAFNTAPPPSSFRSVGLAAGVAGGVSGGGAEELPDFRCPKCQYQAPDMDTLQIHVMDCIQ